MKKKRIGNQRPTKSIFLSEKKSLAKKAVALYEKTGRKAQAWQKNLLLPMLSRNEENLWTHTKFGYSVPRRNGKNEVVAIRELYGLETGETILHTAHRTNTSHAAWERLCKLLDAAGYVEGEDYKSIKQFGMERIEMTGTEGKISFRTRSAKGGLGEGFDLLVIDEAQEYTNDQESALKYVVTDSQNPQTLFCGTPPTPISSGTVFTNLRNAALEGGLANTGWAEWSVEEESDVRDQELWYLTNPSLGTIITERSIADEVGTDEIDFNIQRLGLWIRYNQKSAISLAEWKNLEIKRMPKLKGKLFVGIKYGKDGVNVAMSIAVKTAGGKIFVEAIDCQSVRNGNAWILDFVSRADVGQIVIDGASGQNLLASEMKEQKIKPSPILPTVKEIITANASFEQGIYQESIAHKDQPSLEQVVTNSEKRPIGSTGGFGYKSQFDDYDVALMDSIILAHWACAESKPQKKQRIRY